MNAEKALKFFTTERNQNTINSIISIKQQNNSTTLKNGSKNDNNTNLVASSVSVLTKKTSINADINGDIDTHRKNAADKSIALLFVNDDMSNVKKSIEKTIEEGKRSDTSVQVQQTSRDSSRTKNQEVKESKARKSFPNKIRNYPQLVPRSSTNISSSVDIHTSTYRTENCIEYQMLPPEAGPISARLYHDAQNLTRKMVKLMEEAYKEAVQENRNCESHTVSENHQATVHFLKLQIERMRWQHQQQLAELKHNTGMYNFVCHLILHFIMFVYK